jgi:hypothetical protein
MGMGMPDTDNGMAAIKVEVLFAFIVPHIRAFGFNYSKGLEGVDIEELHCAKFYVLRITLYVY